LHYQYSTLREPLLARQTRGASGQNCLRAATVARAARVIAASRVAVDRAPRAARR
jgi:fructose-specific phosphotransferase system component IIB